MKKGLFNDVGFILLAFTFYILVCSFLTMAGYLWLESINWGY